jgi:transposase
MRTPIVLRTLTTEEVTEIKRLANSRTEAIRLVQRARVIAYMVDDSKLYATDAGLKAGFSSPIIGPTWVRRFNENGLEGLQDKKRPGRKPVHSQRVRSALVSLAQQKPNTLGYPFKLWTLERLQIAFKEREGIHLSDSTIWEWVEAEGFKWKRQESWFHEAEKHDPEFVEKRGAS